MLRVRRVQWFCWCPGLASCLALPVCVHWCCCWCRNRSCRLSANRVEHGSRWGQFDGCGGGMVGGKWWLRCW
ncbi:hypothetical protein COO60DRAFT_1544662 [Scenedesmus sp. NREL 46B-D3]|nr:hypothetical protein COO60DRAFT_1544662 [Scenedesmus sp. NREL 46B-D3]